MIPLLTCALHLAVVTLALYGAVEVVSGHSLRPTTQAGLLLACAGYAAVEAHWSWTVRPRPQRFHTALGREDLLPREHVQAVVTKEPAP